MDILAGLALALLLECALLEKFGGVIPLEVGRRHHFCATTHEGAHGWTLVCDAGQWIACADGFVDLCRLVVSVNPSVTPYSYSANGEVQSMREGDEDKGVLERGPHPVCKARPETAGEGRHDDMGAVDDGRAHGPS